VIPFRGIGYLTSCAIFGVAMVLLAMLVLASSWAMLLSAKFFWRCYFWRCFGRQSCRGDPAQPLLSCRKDFDRPGPLRRTKQNSTRP
jgi:hypothetical protein